MGASYQVIAIICGAVISVITINWSMSASFNRIAKINSTFVEVIAINRCVNANAIEANVIIANVIIAAIHRVARILTPRNHD